jgi:hypothetical protein
MPALDYAAAPYPVRADILAAHRRAWQRLARPGRWWSGAERLAIAREVRHAPACAYCRTAAAALSPFAVDGAHDALADLPAAAVDAVHRIRNDASRLSESWYRGLLSQGLSEGQYVELIGVLATVLAVDEFCRALGLPPFPLPAPEPGAPTRRRPAGARQNLAWVPTLAPEDVAKDDPDLYAGLAGVNIHRALSLVPEEVIGFFDLDTALYLPDAALRDFGREYRDLTHAQIEFLAARISALNRCVY